MIQSSYLIRVLVISIINIGNSFYMSNGFIVVPTSTLQKQNVIQQQQQHNQFRSTDNNNKVTLLWGSKNMIPGTTKTSMIPKKNTIKKKVVSEFTIDNDDDNDDDDEEFIQFVETVSEEQEEVPFSDIESTAILMDDSSSVTNQNSIMNDKLQNNFMNNHHKVKVQYSALEPGTVVQIEIGDMNRSRKAWKKRRRSDSPLLIPCSIVSIDRTCMIRWNCIYLLEKFGTINNNYNSNNNNSNGIQISLTELSIRHRTHLKSSLLQHAMALGYSNSYDLITNIFHRSVQDAYGVQLIIDNKNNSNSNNDSTNDMNPNTQQQLWLTTPLSRHRAHIRASRAAMLQFTESDNLNNNNNNNINILNHTGLVRIKNQQQQQQQQSPVPNIELTQEEEKSIAIQNNNQKTKNNLYTIVPLSVALRVSSNDVLDNIVYNGSRHAAVVFDYDIYGDANIAPLITLSLNPQRNHVRERFKHKQTTTTTTTTTSIRRRRQTQNDNNNIVNEYYVNQLNVGDGPYTGKVVRFIKGGAIIDCNVYRNNNNNKNGNNVNIPTNDDNTTADNAVIITNESVPVYGILRFKDAIVNRNDTSNKDRLLLEDDDDIDDEDDDDDNDWNDIFTIDELNNFDDEEEDDDDDDEDQDEDLNIMSMDDNLVDDEIDDDDDDNDDDEESDMEDGEVLAAFNLENDDEFAEGEDLTHLFKINDDGSLGYTDPATGITKIVSDVNIQDDHDDDNDDDEDDEVDTEDEDVEGDDEDRPVLLKNFATGKNVVDSKKLYNDLSTVSTAYKTQTLHVGDKIDIYIKSISKQSNQLFVSMDASIHGKKAKDIKKDTDRMKKINRCIKQIGGYQRLRQLNGIQCTGTIKALSNTGGDWYYVQPDLENIPVGIATTINNDSEWKVGDIVQVQLNGIDQDRGQLSMIIIDK